MDALAGVSATRVYQLVLNGLPQSGASLTYTLTDPTGAAVTLQSSTVTDNADGTYSVSLDGSADIPTAGTYRELWAGSYGGRDLRAEGPFFVGSDAAGRAMTRRELRWAVADQLGDQWLGTATNAGVDLGPPVQFFITVPELVAPTNDWKGHEIYGYAGPGLGVTRKVTASGNQTGVLYVASLGALDTGTAIEAHKRFTVAQYNFALQDAVRQARGVWVSTEDRSLLQVTGQTEYAIPAGLIWLATVETFDTDGSDTWTTLVRSAGAWDAWPGTLRLASAGTDDVRMRLTGYRYPQGLDYDEQYADLDASYLIRSAASALNASQIRAPALDRASAAQAAAYWQTLAVAQLRRSALQDAIRVAE